MTALAGVDLTALAPATTAISALSNLVLVSPQKTIGYQPLNPRNADGTASKLAQPPTFVFNYEGEQQLLAESDITDHFVEENMAVQDQIALKPEMYTTHGFIGELNDIAPPALALVKVAADKLTSVTAYQPALTETARLAYNEAFLLYQVGQKAINSAIAAASSIGNLITGGSAGGENVIGSSGQTTKLGGQNKQQTAFQSLYGYWRSRTLFTVQTPWAVFQNMAIKSLRAIQDTETNVITDFEVVFKLIRTAASTTLTNGVPISYGGRLNSQASPLTDQGTSAPSSGPSLTSALSTAGVA